jgi:NAD(P)-dependent dehydrogenase (short-subunit alcohol dehydrogenase family)
VALITGAGRGIGRACALALANAGAEVWLTARSGEEIDQVAAQVRAAGGKAQARACDVLNTKAMQDVVAGIPVLDILVNNAGTNAPQPFIEVSEANLDKLLDLNVRAAFLAAQAAAKRMLDAPDRKARGGAIVNISSQMGHVGAVNRSVYCMTKHALEGLTKAMALELAPHGVRVVSVAPTFVETPLTKKMFANAEFAQWANERIPLGGIGRSEDVASAVVFAASPAARLVTGTSLLVDGGWTAQ